MKKIILFTAIVAVTCMFAGCEHNANELKVPSGCFSVAPNRYVKFAPGNLQYTQSTDTWAFAAQQYELLGTDNVVGGDVILDTEEYGDDGYCKYGTALADKIDLFGWSGGSGTVKWGIGISTSDGDYSGDFVDWGQNLGDSKTWRTLTYDEWDYVLNIRTNASSLKGVARINLNDDGSEYANGLILLPDDWQAPTGVLFKSGFVSEYGSQTYATYQTFTLADWLRLEAAGAVFLPASGDRSGASVHYVQTYGAYWSFMSNESDGAYYLFVISAETTFDGEGCEIGRAVRLVQDVIY